MARNAYPVVLYQTEIMNWTEDFVNRLDAGQTITSRDATAMERDGSAAPGGLVGSPSGADSELIVVLDATVAEIGKLYYIDLKATLSSSEVTTQRLALSIVKP